VKKKVVERCWHSFSRKLLSSEYSSSVVVVDTCSFLPGKHCLANNVPWGKLICGSVLDSVVLEGVKSASVASSEAPRDCTLRIEQRDQRNTCWLIVLQKFGDACCVIHAWIGCFVRDAGDDMFVTAFGAAAE